MLTAIGNDYDFVDAFSRQVHGFGQKGDVLIGISSSGKSRNILAAIEEARRRGMVTIALLASNLPLTPETKFVLVAPTAIAASFALAWLLTRLPGARQLL